MALTAASLADPATWTGSAGQRQTGEAAGGPQRKACRRSFGWRRWQALRPWNTALLWTLMTLVWGGGGGVMAQGLMCSTDSCNQTFTVPEDLSVGAAVGTVGNSPATGGLPFKEFFNAGTVDATSVFSVDKSTGRVTTVSALDRERVSLYYFILTTNNNNSVLVLVRLIDVNDNNPRFDPTNTTITFSESTPIGTKQSLGSVTDPDLGINTTQACEIVAGNEGNAFTLQKKKSGEFEIILDLIVNAQLDYEQVQKYTLVIRATDGGGNTGEMTVRINVEDQNDNQPIFNTSKYDVLIPENSTVGTSILKVEATDRDSGENGRITYSIKPINDPKGHFRIDLNTGVVYVNKPLDYETQATYSLTLEAVDNGADSQKGVAALNITLLNINEQPASIHLVFLQGAGREDHIAENTQAGTAVARISISDPDLTTDRQMAINVTLLGGDNVFGLEISNKVLSLVVVNRPPDRELKAEYDLTVIVTDRGMPPLSASKSFKIYIDDVNDNAPLFSSNLNYATVNETAEVGTSVMRITAVDTDDGDNARIYYSIQSGASNTQWDWFQIDSSTGVITTREAIDCELNPQPVLVVTARDSGEPPLSGSTTVIIAVRDVNDKQPEFETSFYSITVDEDFAVGRCFDIQIHATDPECGTNAPVTYQMVRNGDAPAELTINATTGKICVQAPGLDFERNRTYQFLIMAVDRDGLSASAVVQVLINDVNDNDPTFEPQQYAMQVDANVDLGPLLTVQGSDLDSGDFGTVSYSFLNNNGEQFFSIDAGSGTISLIKAFTAGTSRVWRLKVQAMDKGGRVSLVPAEVNITVTSGETHPPTFAPTMYNFTVVESVALGTLVGKVEATVASTSGTGPTSVQYGIIYSSRPQWFRIDPASGMIYTMASLDREAQQFVLLGVRAQTAGPYPLFSTAQVNFTLLDVNDNAPYFPASSVLRIEVREETLLLDPIYVAHAVDVDLGNNGSVRYRLNSPQGAAFFSIDAVSGEMFINSTLDYEQHSSYELVVVAEDQGPGQRLSSSMTLTVSVKDINDNPPIFTQRLYEFNVNESASLGSELGTVVARDADSGTNGRLSYALRASPYPDLFGVFAVQGMLTTRQRLDRESQDTYVLTIVAADHGQPPLSATATVRIRVTDVNDNRPELSRQEYKFTVLENQPRGTTVGQVSATDRDAGVNARLLYSLAIPDQRFTINTFSGELTTLTTLDREEYDSYSLIVNVSDSGDSVQHTATATIRILVQDQNDNSPVFSLGSVVNQTVAENRPKGQQVMKVVATDSDTGENGTVSYYMDPDQSDEESLLSFSVHPVTGWITTEEVLDYETRTRYRLVVIATDGGNPGRSSTQMISLLVENDNDEAPLFHAREMNLSVVENVSVGTEVGVVQAVDKDSGEKGRVNYYLVGGNVFSLFAVETATGVIHTVRAVDYEESSRHTLFIQAVDSDAAFPKSSNISVIIHVVDVNDNAPVFDSDPVFLRSVQENTPVGHVVHTFLAKDKDSGPNGTVRYSIASESTSGPGVVYGSRSNYFRIDEGSGELRVARAIDYEQVHTVSIIVSARDNCSFPALVLSSQVTTVVFVVDVNDNRPRFESRSTVHIFEDEPIGYPVVVVVAVDEDSNEDNSGNNLVSYNIISGNEDGKFHIEQDTGLLTIAEQLDRETRPAYLLNISAEDCGIPKLASYQLLNVSVEDVNDNRPQFEVDVYRGSVNESLPPGTTVAVVRASDSDQGSNGDLTYLIFQGIAGDRFSINRRTGVITTTTTLDRETQEVYIITVYVKDGGYPPLYDMATVYVTVSDVNDHRPVFEKTLYELAVPENQPRAAIISLIASDLDILLNAEIEYKITDGNDGKFTINPKTGDLSCFALDREFSAAYTLTVTATDKGSPPQSSSTQVQVRVLDENDNSPSFPVQEYTATVAEDVARGQTVMRVSASDPDQGANGEVTYLLGNDTGGFFTVNSTTGDIVTSATFDRERNSSFDFLLFASDGGGSGPRNATVRIRITVLDVNDNSPTFRQVPYNVSVSQTVAAGQSILRMIADDPDLDANGIVEYQMLNTTDAHSLRFFTIQRTTGWITSLMGLDQGAAGYHVLLVLAYDRGSPSLSTTGVAEITVGSGLPQMTFRQEEYLRNLPENSPVDTVVTTVGVNYGGSAGVKYSFTNGNLYNTFKINDQGQVSVANTARLDRETYPEFRLIVAAVAGGSHAYAKLRVVLDDDNDNAPKFAQSKYVSAIWENNKALTYVTQVWAKDADIGQNGVVQYTIISGNVDEVFEIDPKHTGIVRTRLEASSLDREVRPYYDLVIQADDNGFPQQSATCLLRINVVDVNNKPPNFPTDGPGPILIPENRQPGYLVAVVTATDVDFEPVLVYDFTSQGNPNHMFSLDRSSGTVVLARSLDFETRAHYTLGIQVTDGHHLVSTTLEVTVTDVNDNPPLFSQQSYQKDVPENALPGHSVLTVRATDADQGPNANITYSLGASSLPAFYIDYRNGTIFTNASILPAVANSVVQLVVVATDGGSPPLSSMVAVRIQITGVNKYTPHFLQTAYSVSINESLPKGAELLTVSALDDDYSHRNDNVHYALRGLSASTFYIHATSGTIMLNGALDREKQSRYDLVATAVDRGAPPKNTSVPVTIYVLDVNDNSPVFDKALYSVTLAENFPLNQVFFTLNASDPDDGANADLEYSITSGNSDGLFFNFKSGGLVVLSHLDYETRRSHRLIVRAVDCNSCPQGSPRLSAFVTMEVNVSDVNEFSPQFTVSHYYETVSENQTEHLTIFQVHAIDQDGGEFGNVTYYLTGEDQEFFYVNHKTGDIITRKRFDYENSTERKVYTLTILATDIDGRNGTAQATISVTDKDEYDPQFLNQSGYQFSVPGSAKAGTYIGTVAARDADGGSAGRLVYSFVQLSDYFQVDPLSGNISVLVALHEDVVPSATDEAVQRRKRCVEEEGMWETTGLRRKKRALRKDSETLIVKVSSGLENSRSSTVLCVISIDRTCPGCQAPVEMAENGGLSSVAIAMIVLVCILVPTAIVVVFLVIMCRRRHRKGDPHNAVTPNGSTARFAAGRDSSGGVTSSVDDPMSPPPYKDVKPHFNNHNILNHHLHGGSGHHSHVITSSDISEQSNNSASSGRGSAEVGVEEEDDEIQMINNANSAGYRHKTMPDSGIQQDEDTLSEPSATNHQEYLARLGIDSSKIGHSKAPAPPVRPGAASSKSSTSGTDHHSAFSAESIHQFSDEGGGEGGVDLTDTEVDEEMVMIENRRRLNQQQMSLAQHPATVGVGVGAGMPQMMPYQPPEPQQAGALSNVVNSEEEYSGSYNWDYLLDWGPQYQPLAHVFAEIAKLKDESITPKKTPVKTVPQRPRLNGARGLMAQHPRLNGPPPIITNAPPPLAESESESGRRGRDSTGASSDGGSSGHKGQSRHTSSTSSSGAGRSQRTSAGLSTSSLPSLPRSPISYESSYTSPALPPSFSPSLSPLGAHTPSISPAVSGHTVGHVSNHSGHSAPLHHNNNYKPVSGSHHHHHPPPRTQNLLQHQHQQAPPQGRGQFHQLSSGGVVGTRLTLSASSDTSEREFRI